MIELSAKKFHENKFHAQKNTRDITGFDIMLPRPIEVQANVIVHLKVTIRSIAGHEIGLQPKQSAETNGIIVNFFQNFRHNFWSNQCVCG